MTTSAHPTRTAAPSALQCAQNVGVKGCSRGEGWDAALRVGGGAADADAATSPVGWVRALII